MKKYYFTLLALAGFTLYYVALHFYLGDILNSPERAVISVFSGAIFGFIMDLVIPKKNMIVLAVLAPMIMFVLGIVAGMYAVALLSGRPELMPVPTSEVFHKFGLIFPATFGIVCGIIGYVVGKPKKTLMKSSIKKAPPKVKH